MAESSVITCPKCKKVFKGKGDLRGKKIRCPFCQEPFVFTGEEEPVAFSPTRTAAKVAGKPPAKETKPVPSKAPAAPAEPAADDDDEYDADGNPYGVTTLDLAPRCPNCANEMESDTAVICLFCGYNTLTRTWGKTEKVVAATFGEHFLYLLPGLLCVLFIFLDISGVIYYCLVLPYYSQGAWWSFVDHESLRLWSATFALFVLWPAGYYAFNRLVMKPNPPDKVKE